MRTQTRPHPHSAHLDPTNDLGVLRRLLLGQPGAAPPWPSEQVSSIPILHAAAKAAIRVRLLDAYQQAPPGGGG